MALAERWFHRLTLFEHGLGGDAIPRLRPADPIGVVRDAITLTMALLCSSTS